MRTLSRNDKPLCFHAFFQARVKTGAKVTITTGIRATGTRATVMVGGSRATAHMEATETMITRQATTVMAAAAAMTTVRALCLGFI